MQGSQLSRVTVGDRVPGLAIAVISLNANAQPTSASAATPVRTIRDCPDCSEVIVSPPESFSMGCPLEDRVRERVSAKYFGREGPVLLVTISKPFAISHDEITRGMYARIIAAVKRPEPSIGCGVFDPVTDSWPERPPHSGHNTNFYQFGDHPAALHPMYLA